MIEKVAILLAFSETFSDDIFSRLIARYHLGPASKVHAHLELEGSRLVVASITPALRGNKAKLIPMSFSFGSSSIHHQGALLVDPDGSARLYEPYGTYMKRLHGTKYDYFEPLAAALGGTFKAVTRWHTGPGIQQLYLDHCDQHYSEFTSRFIDWVKAKPADVRGLLKRKLEEMDVSSESSRLAYLVEAMFQLRKDPLADELLLLYKEYSPYLCVSFTIVEMLGVYDPEFYPNMVALYGDPHGQTYSVLERAMRLLAPRLLEQLNRPFYQIYNDIESLKLNY